MRLAPQIDPNGYGLVAFGLNSFTIIHVNTSLPDFYEYQLIKEYTDIQPTNQSECLTISKMYYDNLFQEARTGQYIQEMKWLLGTGSKQKISKFILRIKYDENQDDSNKVRFIPSDSFFYQEPKSIKARLSSFISAKLGFNQQETQQSVKDIHIQEEYAIVVTNKDVLVILIKDATLIYSTDYQNLLQGHVTEKTPKNVILNDIIQLKFISSTSSYRDQCLFVEVFMYRETRIQYSQTYNINENREIISLSFSIPASFQPLAEDQGQFLIIDYGIDNFVSSDLLKSFSYSFNKPDDLMTLTYLNFKEGKTILIEYSQKQRICNTIKDFGGQQLIGYSIYESEPIQIVLITSSEIVFNNIYANSYIDFKSSVEQVQIKNAMQLSTGTHAVERVQQAQLKEGFVAVSKKKQFNKVKREDIINFIFSLLDRVDQYRNGGPINEEKLIEIKSDLEYEIQASYSTLTKQDYLNAIKNIVIGQMDLAIQDQIYSVNLTEEAQNNLLLQDNGLIQANIKKKLRKLEVIDEFVRTYRVCEQSYQEDQQQEYFDYDQLYNNIYLKLITASKVRDLQEKIKDETKLKGIITLRNLPLNLRIFTGAIRISAAKLGFDKTKLEQMGITPLHITFQFISKFETFLLSLFELCLNRTAEQNYMVINQNETDFDILTQTSSIISTILSQLLTDKEIQTSNIAQSYLASEDIFSSLYLLCVKTGDLVQFKKSEQSRDQLRILVKLFFDLAIRCQIEKTNEFAQWRDGLVRLIETHNGRKEALDLAETYVADQELCRMVFEGGKQFYEYIHRCVRTWGNWFLISAIRMIYLHEIARIKEIRKTGVKDFNPQYSGFQLFDIFEKDYPQDLHDFLQTKNQRLYAIFQIRQRQPPKFTQDTLCKVVQSSSNIDSVKAFSSLGEVLSTYCTMKESQTNRERKDYFEAKLNLAQYQEKFKGQVPNTLQRIDTNFLVKAKQVIIEENKAEEPSKIYKQLFTVIDYAVRAIDDNPNSKIDLPELLETAWTQVISDDDQNIRNLISMLPDRNENNEVFRVYTEYQIEQQARDTLVFQVASYIYPNERISLQEEQRDMIYTRYPELRRGLDLIFRLIEDRNSSQRANFTQNSQLFSAQISHYGSQQL